MADSDNNLTESILTGVGAIVDWVVDYTSEAEEDTPTTLHVEQQADGQKVYTVTGQNDDMSEDSSNIEIYTETQIDNMRKEVAMADSMKAGVQANQTSGEALEDWTDRYKALSDGTYAEANEKNSEIPDGHVSIYDTDTINYELTSSVEGEDDADVYEKGRHIVTFDGGENWDTYENTMDITADASKWMGSYQRPAEDIDRMREIIAEVDALDGKGNYEDNLNAMQNDTYVNDAEKVCKEQGTSLEDKHMDFSPEDEVGKVFLAGRMDWAIAEYASDHEGDKVAAFQDLYEATYASDKTSNDLTDDDEIYKNAYVEDTDTNSGEQTAETASSVDNVKTASSKSRGDIAEEKLSGIEDTLEDFEDNVSYQAG